MGEEELLFASNAEERVESCSADGKYLAYLRRDPAGQEPADIWILPLAARGKPFPFIESGFHKGFPAFSPDGRWMAYGSNESGRSEIYVAPFPTAKGKWQVSSSGGTFPRWRGDGKELFYLGPDNRIRATEIAARGNSVRLGSTQTLFTSVRPNNVQTVPTPSSPFDVTADGNRFPINTMPDGGRNAEPVALIVNWNQKLGSIEVV